MRQAEFARIVSKYQHDGIRKGSEFLLHPQKAIDMVNDLEEASIEMYGISGWYYVKLANGGVGIAEDLAYDLSVPDGVIHGNDSVKQSASIVRGFLSQLPKEVELVSIVIDTLFSWITPGE